jgi:hypothetical protein
VRSRRLKPGQQTFLDIDFNPRVDGPGRHGALVRQFTNDRHATKRAATFPLASAVAFYITVNPPQRSGGS